MIRVQIQLSDEQKRKLLRWARRLGISLSEAVRRCVDERLGREDIDPSPDARASAALSVCGKYEEEAGDGTVAERHDRHLEEAFGK